jgi:hypothetical protein
VLDEYIYIQTMIEKGLMSSYLLKQWFFSLNSDFN